VSHENWGVITPLGGLDKSLACLLYIANLSFREFAANQSISLIAIILATREPDSK